MLVDIYQDAAGFVPLVGLATGIVLKIIGIEEVDGFKYQNELNAFLEIASNSGVYKALGLKDISKYFKVAGNVINVTGLAKDLVLTDYKTEDGINSLLGSNHIYGTKIGGTRFYDIFQSDNSKTTETRYKFFIVGFNCLQQEGKIRLLSDGEKIPDMEDCYSAGYSFYYSTDDAENLLNSLIDETLKIEYEN